MYIFIVLVVGSIVGVIVAAAVLSKAQGKGKWGINIKQMACPRCGQSMPALRKPADAKEALWGGWTCPNCGCKVDKWGKEIAE